MPGRASPWELQIAPTGQRMPGRASPWEPQIAPTGQRMPGRASPWELQIAPTGQRIPAQGANPGNRIPENRCVLKEHRIRKAGVDIRGPRLCGVPSERRFLFSGWIPRVGTLGWYAMPRWGMGSKTSWRNWLQRSRTDTLERDARWGMNAGSKCHCSICPNGATHARQGISLGTANCPNGATHTLPRAREGPGTASFPPLQIAKLQWVNNSPCSLPADYDSSFTAQPSR
jgi:hypothetical protein